MPASTRPNGAGGTGSSDRHRTRSWPRWARRPGENRCLLPIDRERAPMRYRTLTAWTIGTILLGTLAYTAAFAIANYLETSDLVNRIAADAAAKGMAAADAQLPEARQPLPAGRAPA